MVTSGSLGKVRYWRGGKFIASSLLFVLTKKEENIKYEYLYHYLKLNRKMICEKYSNGSSKITINKVNLSKLKIPVPSKEIQQQCISLFEEKEKFIQSIDEKIKTEQNYIEELKQLAKDVISFYC